MKRLLIACLLLLSGIGTAHAELTNTAANGFTSKHQAVVQAPTMDVWKTIIAPGKWWSSDHTFSGNAENLYLVPQAGGCFCELIRRSKEDNIKSSAGSVQHMRVIFVSNEKVLRMSGALGPLQGEALVGTLSITLKPDGDATVVQFIYKVGGYMEFELDQIAPAVDGMIGEQLTRLAATFEVAEAEDEAVTETEVEAKDES